MVPASSPLLSSHVPQGKLTITITITTMNKAAAAKNPNFDFGGGGDRGGGGGGGGRAALDSSLSLHRRLRQSASTGTIRLCGLNLTVLPTDDVLAVMMGEYKYDDADTTSTYTSSQAFSSSSSPKWWETNQITKVDISNNQITNLPPDVLQHETLEVLCAHTNKLVGVSCWGENMRDVDVTLNEIEVLPPLTSTIARLKASQNRLEELPLSQHNGDSALADLDASDNKTLKNVPDAFGEHFRFLVRLRLADCALERLPEEMFAHMQRLDDLDIAGNILQALPKSLGKASAMRRIDASRNRIVDVPTLPTKQLAEIVLANNRPLAHLPSCVAEARALRTVVASRCGFTAFPPPLLVPDGPPIATLDLADNDIATVAPEMARRADTLRALCLQGNPIRSVRQALLNGPMSKLMAHLVAQMADDDNGMGIGEPFHASAQRSGGMVDISAATVPTQAWAMDAAARGVFTGVQKIQAANAPQIDELPLAAIPSDDWESVVSIVVKSCGLRAWPDCTPPNLEELCLEQCQLVGNGIPRIAEEIGATLRILRLNHCGKHVVFDDDAEAALEQMPNLEELALQGLGIRRIPTRNVVASGAATRLRVLDVSNNRIAEISPEVAHSMCALEELNCSNNDIGDLPPELGLMAVDANGRLSTLMLDGNPLRKIRRGVLEAGTPRLLAYLREKL